MQADFLTELLSPYCFAGIKTGPLEPLNFAGAPQLQHKQLIEADFVYFKDTIEAAALSNE